MRVLFVNISTVCLNHLLKVINLFVELSYLLVLYLSQCLTVNCINLLLSCASPVRITISTFHSHIPSICYTNASMRSFFSKVKTTSFLKSSLSSHQKYAPIPLLSLLTHQIKKLLVLPLLQHFLFHLIRTVAELLQFLVPFYLPILWLFLLIL